MKEYKKQALKQFELPDDFAVYFLKNRLDTRYCDKCKKKIEKSEVYFCNKWISSYLVDYFGSYHLQCVSKSDILKMLNKTIEGVFCAYEPI